MTEKYFEKIEWPAAARYQTGYKQQRADARSVPGDEEASDHNI
jgi:hypothetical protein